jgi:hypothetical protein
MGPCISFGWNRVNKKTVLPKDEKAYRAMQMLGTVDYNTDQDSANNVVFAHAMSQASTNTACKVVGW